MRRYSVIQGVKQELPLPFQHVGFVVIGLISIVISDPPLAGLLSAVTDTAGYEQLSYTLNFTILVFLSCLS
jgi:hypothetical protein